MRSGLIYQQSVTPCRSTLLPDVPRGIVSLGFGAIRLGGDFEEHVIRQVFRVAVVLLLGLLGGNNDPSDGISRCNRQKNLAIVRIHSRLTRSPLGVFVGRAGKPMQVCLLTTVVLPRSDRVTE